MGKSKYPVVNYIGNKEKVSQWIISSLPISHGIVVDLFCGGCSISYALKENGFKVISNDALYANYVIAKAIIENSCFKLFPEDYENLKINNEEIEEKYLAIKDLFENKIYFDYEVKELARLALIGNQLKGYKKYLFLSLLRRAMIRKIPYSRMNVKWEEIKKFRDEQYSYQKYGRYRHYHNVNFIEHIKSNTIGYNNSIFDSGKQCLATNYDGLEFINNLTFNVDLIYMDPPYPSTMNKYEDFYGLFDKLFDKKPQFKTDLTDKNTFLNNFEKIFSSCVGKAKYVVISLNNNCFPGIDKMINCITPYIYSYEVKTKEHVYKVTGKGNKHSNYEVLLICKIKEG